MTNLLKNKKIHLLVIFIAVVLTHLPFLHQAFNIDAPHFIYMARQINSSPLLPYSYSINWHGTVQSGFQIMANPPLFGYYLAGVTAFFGEKELPLNASMIFFSIIACISMYFLARRFTKYPLLASLLLLATPAFMVNSHTVMADTAFLAFCLVSLAFFIYALDNNRVFMLILSGIFAGICCLVKYNGLSVFAIFLLYAASQKKFLNIKSWVPVFIGFFIFSLWCFASFKLYGKVHPFILFDVPGKYTYAHKYMVAIKLICQVSYLGGAAVFPVACLIFRRRGLSDRAFFILSLALAAFIAVISTILLGYHGINLLLAVVFLTAGFYFICLTAKFVLNKERNSDDIFLAAWFFGMIIFNAVFTAVNVRYFLIALAPAIFLFFRLSYRFNASRMFYAVVLTATFLTGAAVSSADYVFADTYRNFAQKEADVFKNSNNKIRFAGHWGFQYYMEKEGFIALSEDDTMVNKGDKIIAALLPWPEGLDKSITDRMKLTGKVNVNSFLPIRVMSRAGHANFYSYVNFPAVIGFLPYSFSSAEVETFLIYDIN